MKLYLIFNLEQTTEQQNDDNCLATTSDSEFEKNDNSIESSLAANNRLQSNITETQTLTRPNLTLKSIPGVIFINTEELSFVDKQRVTHPHIKWYPDSADHYQKHKYHDKPSSQWFTRERPWLRAVCSDERYGLLCTDCSEFGSNSTKITRNGGAFIARPFWKLRHKGIEGMLEFLFL